MLHDRPLILLLEASIREHRFCAITLRIFGLTSNFDRIAAFYQETHVVFGMETLNR